MTTLAKVAVPLGALLCLVPMVPSWLALLAGIAVAVVLGNPHLAGTKKATAKLLPYSVVGLGAGMNLSVVARVGASGIGYTVAGIALTLGIGWILGRILHTPRDTSTLVSVGTAICGGSAIAAVGPAIEAKSQDMSVALGTVFLLNATALVLFPPIGHRLGLSEPQFGLWAALAIHDTSSVVGAAMQYGPEALAVGTTVKLARALWIVPVTVLFAYAHRRRHAQTGAPTAKRPWFILGFLIAAAVVTWIPALHDAGKLVEAAARRGLVATLFLIGASLTKEALKSVGVRPFLQGLLLWLLVGSATLAAVVFGLIA
ncbi:MAG TPA: putative sulfate exporter family transporter [Thermoanaerobaculia bacterium]|nr:putative sulfate exporter family transporter [Thermoanaerobaculia bacterium]